MTSEKSFVPSWFNNMKVKEQHKEYIIYSYIKLDIYTTPDSKFFNATRLMKLLTAKVREDGSKSNSKSMTSLMKSKKWQLMQKKHPELFKEIKGRFTQTYKGVYLQWILFSTFIGYASAGADINFELGEPIEEDTTGFVYCCIPESCEGTDTMKFGRTWNWKQRVNGYGINTELLYLVPVDDMYLEEEKMLNYMNSFLTQDKEHGDEYFIVSDQESYDKAFNYFEDLMKKYNVKNLESEYRL